MSEKKLTGAMTERPARRGKVRCLELVMRKPLKIGRSYSVALSPDQTRLAALGRFIFVWDLQLGKNVLRCQPFSHPSHASFSPSGKVIAVKNTPGRIVIVDADDGDTVADFQNQSDGEGSNLTYSACGDFVVDGSWAGWLRVRQSSDGKTVFEEQFPHEMIRAVHRDASNQRWIVEHQPKVRPSEKFAPPAYFSLWEWPFRTKTFSVLPYRIGLLCSSALSTDGRHLALVRRDTSTVLEVCGVPSETPLWTAPISVSGTGSALSWSPDGSLLASVQEKKIAVYRVPGLSRIAEFALEYPADIAFCPMFKSVELAYWQQGLVAPVEW